MSEFFDDVDFEKFRSLIYKESGITFSDTNRTILESRLRERVKLASVATVKDYYSLISRDNEELKTLLDAVTTNLTRFFRNTAHFDTLINYVIPDLLKHKSDKEIRLWSAGCSTGEEPYTIAMILKDILPAGTTCKIVASDISLKCLMTGKEGFYPDTRVEGISPQYLTRFLEKKGNGYSVKDDIKRLVRFDYHNLKNDSGLRNLDIVFCRNVLIYFDEAAQKAAVDRFWDAMSSHSFLFIGHSESLFGMDTKFEFLKTNWACIYKKFV
jgi:chemotaxis protein methyltransferase CheR